MKVPNQATQPMQIKPLVARHAGDAAFYWMQRHTNAYSPVLRFEKLLHWDSLLDAHLAGLRAAGELGWEYAVKNLKRWRSTGECFVAALLTFESGDNARLDTLWAMVKNHPDTAYTGLIAALAWLAPEQRSAWLAHWLDSNDFAGLQMLALRGYAAARQVPQRDLSEYFAAPHAFLRDAACRVVGAARLQAYRPHVFACLRDPEPGVRAAAALALVALGDAQAVVTELWHGLQYHVSTAGQAKGFAAQTAARQAQTYARHAAHAFPINQYDWEQVAQMLPPRIALTLFAHHGDPGVIPLILRYVHLPEWNRLAAWAISMMTDLDFDAVGVAARAPAAQTTPDETSAPPADPDSGLPWVNPDALGAWWRAHAASHYVAGQRMLLGERADATLFLFDILDTGTQAERFAAAQHLLPIAPEAPVFETRAQAIIQRHEIDRRHRASIGQ